MRLLSTGMLVSSLTQLVCTRGNTSFLTILSITQWHGEDDVGLRLVESLGNQCRAGLAGEEEDVVAQYDIEHELGHQPVHVSHGQGGRGCCSSCLSWVLRCPSR